ncbi:glycosyltransferase [Candidatus Bathyarchaeota archaeon]|nr:glycosyltransferase [Candidatus Bathyarchaeota archaeon]
MPLCLKSIANQRNSLLEVLVVDNCSVDETKHIAKEYGAKLITHRGTQSDARNVGMAYAKGDFILFLDSDQQLESGLIEDCFSTCLKKGVEAVKIPEVYVGLDFWGSCSALWKNRMVEAWGLNGGIPRFYKRDVLKCSTFKENMRFWEDVEFYQRLRKLGVKEAWCKRHIIHFEVGSLRSVISKYVSYGRSIAEFRRSHLKAPYALTLRLTISTLIRVIRNPGKVLSVFLGCLFLVAIKGLSLTLGFSSQLWGLS